MATVVSRNTLLNTSKVLQLCVSREDERVEVLQCQDHANAGSGDQRPLCIACLPPGVPPVLVGLQG